MTIQTLSRKEKRARIAKAAKLYGIKGEESLALHEAYMALGAGDIRTALQLAHPVTRSHPGNAHGWVILGAAALNQREGRTACAFFGKALEGAPKDPAVMGGLAKGHILEAEVEPAVHWAERAIRAGSDDAGLIGLYLQLMSDLGRKLSAAEVVAPAARRLDSAAVSLALGNMLAEAEEPGRAAEFLERAWRLDPLPEAHRIARLTALLYQVRLDECLEMGRGLLDTVGDRDAVAVVMMTALRVQRRLDEVVSFAEGFDFATPEGYARSRGIVSNVLQDRADHAGAEAAYREAMHLTGQPVRSVQKSYGVFLYRAGSFAEGFPYFAARFPEPQRARLPLANSEPGALAQRQDLILMAEQGIGDQIAMMALLRLAPLAEGCRVTFVGDARHAALLRDNAFGMRHLDIETFLGGSYQADPRGLVYLGDLTRFLADHPRGAHGGAFLVADAKRRDHLRRQYEARAAGAPIVGVAWASRSLIGRLRSLELAELCRALPEGALVVNLQYGDCSAEIAAARAARPDLSFVTDGEVDQMADLAGFAAQIMALDRVVTIDNTTAHLAGALGHPDAHMLVPAGSECMWYWGTEGSSDPWYGTLHLHRQVALSGNWDRPLAEIRALPRA
ncbi:hypothetical protein [Pseudooceanicola nanhaiensis]|jgi:Tfp pilus assembly protein PilF|uniref:hypothetical protein n=1 Tax=Pseudooceanicola nanhaiensis TaxID=375761 RepID=UPI00300B7B50